MPSITAVASVLIVALVIALMGWAMVHLASRIGKLREQVAHSRSQCWFWRNEPTPRAFRSNPANRAAADGRAAERALQARRLPLLHLWS